MKKHADFESKFSFQTISSAEQLEILHYAESNKDQDIDIIIEAFQKDGRLGLQKLHDKTMKDKGGK